MDEISVIAIVLVVIALRVGAHFLDLSRIRDAAQQHGWRNVDVRWSPFSAGWITEPRQRFYEVSFKDRNGAPGYKTCKTSLLGGISWIDRFSQGL